MEQRARALRAKKMGWHSRSPWNPEVRWRAPREAGTEGCLYLDWLVPAEAIAYVEHVDPRVILIDGKRLAQLMIDFEVGVASARTYHVKRVDSDYVEES